MPSLDVIEKPEEEPKQEEATLSKPIIGIIYPPPEVRSILMKMVNKCDYRTDVSR